MMYRKLSLSIFCTILTVIVFGQSIEGNTRLCEKSNLILKLVLADENPSLEYSFLWYKENRAINYSGREFEKKEVTVNDSGQYSCIVTVTDPLKNVSDSTFKINEYNVSVDVLVYSNPSTKPKPSYTRYGNDILLHIARNNINLDYEWTGPSNDTYSGAVVDIKQVRLDQLGKYSLIIKDTISGCSSNLELDVESSNNVEKPSNVFGTIDEDTGELTGVLRQVDRNFPIYPCNILGRKASENFIIADPTTVWQIIGEINNNYIIKNILTDKYDYSLRDSFRNSYYAYLNEIEFLRYEIDSISRIMDSQGANLGANFRNFEDGILERSINISKQIDNITFLFEVYKDTRYFKFHEYIPIDEIREYFIYDENTHDLSPEEYNRFLYDRLDKKISDQSTKDRYFLVDRTDFEIRSRVYKHKSRLSRPGLTAGTVLIPVKLRFDEFQFSKDITLGPYFGLKWLTSNFKPNYYSFGFSTGITSVRLTPRNTDSDFIQEVQDVSAFTLSIGSILEFNNVQLGLFLGWDWINNNKGDTDTSINWRYQGKPWLSLGLGYSIINRPSSNISEKKHSNRMTE